MRVCLFSPSSLPLSCGGMRRRRRRCRQGWVLSYLEESLLNWATVIHQLLSFPLETPWICTLAGNPTGLCSFSISALYSFSISAHSSFCLFQLCAFIVASHSGFSLSLVSSTVLVYGDDFFLLPLDTNSNFFHCQPLTTETLHFLQHCFKCTKSRSDPLFLPLSLNFPFPLFFYSSQGGPDASRHTQAAGLHPFRLHLGHPLPHRRHPDAVRGRVHPRRGLYRAGPALRGQEVQRLARSASLKVVAGFGLCNWVLM